jgi:hypothetical protein
MEALFFTLLPVLLVAALLVMAVVFYRRSKR